VKKQSNLQTQVTWPKYQILKIQDGGRSPFWKLFHHYISAADHPISMKFGVPLQILILRTFTWQGIKILQIQNGGRPPYWKSCFGYISTIYCPINVKIDRKKQIYVQILVTWPKIPKFENSRWRTTAILKMVSSLYLRCGSSDFNEIWCAAA